MAENRPELRGELQQKLNKEAQQIEGAKDLITAMKGNSGDSVEAALRKAYPDLTEQDIKNLLGR